MKRFLKTFFAFAAVIAAVVLLVNGVYITRMENSWASAYSYVKDVPEGIQICNFGSSHGLLGFDYEEIPEEIKCFNFGLNGQVPSYDYRILQNYRDNISEGAVVFLPLSYFSFFGEDETELIDFASKNQRYYRFLKDEYIKEYDSSTRIWARYFPAMASGRLNPLIRDLLSEPATIDRWDDEADATEMAEHGAKMYQGQIESKLDGDGNRDFNQEEIDSVYSFIELCKESGFTPVLVTTPFLDEFNSQVRDNDPTFYDDFYGVIDQIVEDTGVQYYDYSADERFTHDYSLFRDTDHLNRSGAKKFTSILEKEVLPEVQPAR